MQPSEIANPHLNIALTQVKLGFWVWEIDSGGLHTTLQNKLNFGFNANDEFNLESVILAILPEDRARREEALQRALDPDCGTYSFDCRVRHTNHSLHWLQINGTVIFEGGKASHIIGTSLDITDKKDLEILRDEVLNIANHELKTPLSAVKGYLQLLHRFIARTGNEQYEKIAYRALSATERITLLLGDALQQDAVQANEMVLRKEPVNLQSLVEEIAANTMLVSQSHRIELLTEGSIPTIEVDRYRIGQALTNLMNNAVKYSPDHNFVDITITASNKYIRISIRDYGIGIPKAEQDKIFDKFYRVKTGYDSIPGSGIGLFLTSEIIARHGGQIGLEPVDTGSGTAFYFTLPR